MSFRTAISIAVTSLMAAPTLVHAHGNEGTAETIDQHHAELKDSLQKTLGDAYDTPVEGLDNADIDAGKALYDQHCASCHGASGKGDGTAAASLSEKPSDLTNGDQMKFISDAGFVEVIRSGLPDAGMPGYGSTLSEQELVQVYAYTKTLRTETAASEDSHACSAGPVGSTPSSGAWIPLLLAIGALAVSRVRRTA